MLNLLLPELPGYNFALLYLLGRKNTISEAIRLDKNNNINFFTNVAIKYYDIEFVKFMIRSNKLITYGGFIDDTRKDIFRILYFNNIVILPESFLIQTRLRNIRAMRFLRKKYPNIGHNLIIPNSNSAIGNILGNLDKDDLKICLEFISAIAIDRAGIIPEFLPDIITIQKKPQ